MPSHVEIERAFRLRERTLWGLCYRLTGVAADADELVQETFVRAIERPPPAADDDWHRWLVRVATNLSLDRLRARRRRSYVGSWLPAPIEISKRPWAEDGVEAGPRAARERVVCISSSRSRPWRRARARSSCCVRSSTMPPAGVASVLDTSESNCACSITGRGGDSTPPGPRRDRSARWRPRRRRAPRPLVDA